MKRIVLVTIVIITALMGSCKNKDVQDNKKTDLQIISIDPDQPTASKYSQFIDSIKYIALDTPPNSYIGDFIMKILFDGEHYFLFDENKIFIYDKTGHYLLDVGRKGRGPGEMISPVDFIVDTTNKTIEILSEGDGKIFIYKLKDGRFMKEIKLQDIAGKKFFKLRKNVYLIEGFIISEMKNASVDNLIFYDYERKKVLKKLLTKPSFLMKYHGISMNSFSKVKNGILFMRSLDNNIYIIDKEKNVNIKYKVDYGKYNLPLKENFFAKYKYLDDIKDYAIQFTGFFANNFYLTFIFYINNKNYIVFIDLKNNIYLYGKQFRGIINDVDLGPVIFPVGIYNNILFGSIEPMSFKKHYKKIKQKMGAKRWTKFIEDHPDIAILLENIKPDDNPIIALYYLKKKFKYEN
jgi:hypothetical protein